MDFKVLTCSRNSGDIEALQEEFASSGAVRGIAVDLAEKEGCQQFVDFVNSEADTIDCLINNAGIFIPGEVHKEENSTFEKLMSINLNSAYYITKGLIQKMIARKQGHIFNMCSTASITAYPNGGSYSISKYALMGFSKVLREEMKEHNVKVTAVIPGATFTPSWKDSGIPESRFMKSSDVAKSVTAAYQLSEQAVVEELLIRPQLGDI